MTPEQQTYERGCQLTYHFVKGWLRSPADLPRFRFPPRDVALLAGLDQVAENISLNDSARRLVDHLVEEIKAATGQVPTTMMLRVVLESLGQPIEWVPFEELGLRGQLVPMGKGGSA